MAHSTSPASATSTVVPSLFACLAMFPDEASAVQWFAQQVWGGPLVGPTCGSTRCRPPW